MCLLNVFSRLNLKVFSWFYPYLEKGFAEWVCQSGVVAGGGVVLTGRLGEMLWRVGRRRWNGEGRRWGWCEEEERDEDEEWTRRKKKILEKKMKMINLCIFNFLLFSFNLFYFLIEFLGNILLSFGWSWMELDGKLHLLKIDSLRIVFANFFC